MPLEATVVALDNSEWMRNGDFVPNRMEAMRDAANLVCDIKVKQNPESSVGLVAGGGDSPKVLCSCTQDAAVLLTAVADLRIQGKFDYGRSLQVAALALKHRRNKNGGQRIIIFVGSPVVDDNQKLVKLGKNLKKNSVAVDVVLMGETETNEEKLRAFVEAVDKQNNSHLIVVPAGVLPSDVLLSSPVLTEDGGGGGGEGGHVGGGGGQLFAEYGGVNPELDPEMAMVLRASLEEERARQEREAAAQAAAGGTAPVGDGAGPPAAAAAGNASMEVNVNIPEDMPPLLGGTAAPKPATVLTPSPAELDEEALLQQALAMSMNDMGGSAPTTEASSSSAAVAASSGGGADDAMDEEDEAAAIAKAIAMSQEEENASPAPKIPQPTSTAPNQAASQPSGVDLAGQFADPAFVNQLLADLPGVDPNDPAIQAMLAQLADPNATSKPSTEESNKKAKKDGDS